MISAVRTEIGLFDALSFFNQNGTQACFTFPLPCHRLVDTIATWQKKEEVLVGETIIQELLIFYIHPASPATSCSFLLHPSKLREFQKVGGRNMDPKILRPLLQGRPRNGLPIYRNSHLLAVSYKSKGGWSQNSGSCMSRRMSGRCPRDPEKRKGLVLEPSDHVHPGFWRQTFSEPSPSPPPPSHKKDNSPSENRR